MGTYFEQVVRHNPRQPVSVCLVVFSVSLICWCSSLVTLEECSVLPFACIAHVHDGVLARRLCRQLLAVWVLCPARSCLPAFFCHDQI